MARTSSDGTMIEYETRVNEKELVSHKFSKRISTSSSSSTSGSVKSYLQSEPTVTHLESDLRNYIDKQEAKLPRSTCNPFKDNLVLTKLEILEVSPICPERAGTVAQEVKCGYVARQFGQDPVTVQCCNHGVLVTVFCFLYSGSVAVRTRSGPVQLNPVGFELLLMTFSIVQIVICGILLMPIRLVAIFILFSIKFICTFIMTVTYGKENLDEKPMTGWRLFIRTHILRRICKVTVFACGFHRVKINGKRADKDECRIIVAAPHTTFMDSLVFFVLDLPIVVMARMTVFSYIARGAQAIIVKRRKAGHGKRKLEPIIARSDPNTTWPQLLIFPEGTTTNGSCLISYKSGELVFTALSF